MDPKPIIDDVGDALCCTGCPLLTVANGHYLSACATTAQSGGYCGPWYREQVAALRAQLAAAEAYIGNEVFRSDFRTASDMRLALESAETALAAARADCERFKHEMLVLDDSRQRALNDLAAARAQTEKYSGILSMKNRELSAARAENERLRSSDDKVGAEIHKMLTELASLESQLDRKNEELAALRARPDDGRVERVHQRGCLLQPCNGACVNRRMVCDKDETICKWLAAADGEAKP